MLSAFHCSSRDSNDALEVSEHVGEVDRIDLRGGRPLLIGRKYACGGPAPTDGCEEGGVVQALASRMNGTGPCGRDGDPAVCGMHRMELCGATNRRRHRDARLQRPRETKHRNIVCKNKFI